MKRICIIEDDESIRHLIRIALERFGYIIYDYESGEEALQNLATIAPDLCIVDWMLPGIDGLEIVRAIRNDAKFHSIPIMFLTAKDSEYDKILGLDSGSDDYMTKPFSVLELAARIRSLLRRSYKEENLLRFKELVIDEDKREVYLYHELISLTYKEYELLVYLLKNERRVVTREELLEKVWGYDYLGESRTLDMHIKSLRKKISEDYAKHIKTIRGVGYRFDMKEDSL